MFSKFKDNLLQDKTNIHIPAEYIEAFKLKLIAAQISFTHIGADFKVSRADLEQIQPLITEVILPNLVPAQFYWLLAKSGLEPVTRALLEQLQNNDLDQYAVYKAFLQGARHYEFNKAIDMLNQAKPLIEQSYPDIDLSVATLRSLWLQASKF